MAAPPPAPPAASPGAALRWQFAVFAELTPADLYAALQLRSLVFVVEQTCPFLDADGSDDQAWHLLGWQTEAPNGRRLAAYARLFRPGVKYAEASIGRVVTHPDARRTGAGRALMAESLRRLTELAPGAAVRIGAQKYLEHFYAGFGFARAGDDYLEDGIVHLEMVRAA